MRKKTVLVSGNFNVLHPGHLRLLRFAKDFGGHLVVAVIGDKLAGSDAYVPESLRLDGVRANSLVDEAFIAYESIDKIIARIQPDLVVKGREHELQFNVELAAVNRYGGRLVFSSGEAVFSSLDLIKREFKDVDFHSISLPNEFLKRHGISTKRLKDLVLSFSSLKVCVIGDLIVDEYITCQPLGMSQEDPTIVVTPIDSTYFIGGAGIVSAHAAGLGANVNFFSIIGNDQAGQYASQTLTNASVRLDLFVDDSRPTSLKQRYRSKGKSLFRVSYLHQDGISLYFQNKIYDSIALIIDDLDLLVFSDFNYGCLPQALVDRIATLAKANSVMVVGDSQSSSQIGDIGRFKGFDLITPTEREARISTRNREDGLVILAEALRSQAMAKNVLLKLGEEGVLIHADDGRSMERVTDRILALNSAPKDVAGAGDSLLIVSSMTLAAGGNIWEAAALGSLAAAVQVGRVGNTPIVIEELIRELV